MRDQPDQATPSMGDDPDGLMMSEAPDTTAIDNLEDTSFDFYGDVGGRLSKRRMGRLPFGDRWL